LSSCGGRQGASQVVVQAARAQRVEHPGAEVRRVAGDREQQVVGSGTVVAEGPGLAAGTLDEAGHPRRDANGLDWPFAATAERFDLGCKRPADGTESPRAARVWRMRVRDLKSRPLTVLSGSYRPWSHCPWRSTGRSGIRRQTGGLVEDWLITRLRVYNGAAVPRRVLVVDDDPDIRDLLVLVLSDEGYEALAAPDGRAALAVAAEQAPALVLLDYNMPVCDAPAFVATYRRRPPPHAPIVVMTAAHNVERRAAEVGADAWLGKPFELGALLDVVARYAA
jgi:CheY-like chemotaxis protein